MKFLHITLYVLTVLKDLVIFNIRTYQTTILVSLLFILSTMIGVLVSVYLSGFVVLVVFGVMWFLIPVDSKPLISIMFGLLVSLFIYVALMLFTPDTYEKLAVMTHQNYNTNACGKSVINAEYEGEKYTITVPKECSGQYLTIYRKYEAKEFIDDFDLIASCKQLDNSGKITTVIGK